VLSAFVVRRARLGSRQTDLRIEGERIAAIGADLRRGPGDGEIDARGGEILPGLHDHHLHLLALAAAGQSVPVGPAQVRDRAAFSAALARAAASRPRGEWIRAVGYHQSVAGDLDRDALDQAVRGHPVRVQHRSGSLWICNSAALAALDADAVSSPGIERDDSGRLTGRLWRMDHWLADRLGVAGSRRDQLADLSAAAAAAGVTAWTEATPERSDRDTDVLLDAVVTGAVRQRLHLMVPTKADEPACRRMQQVGVTVGPVKIMLDDASLPPLDALTALVSGAHGRGRPVAVHCVTRVQLLLTLAALDAAGIIPGDRIEHGALIPTEVLPQIAKAGLVVVTQPNFVAERGDQYLLEVEGADLPDLWRARSLVGAGIAVAAGTDAPFGSADPWQAVRAAVRRRTASGLPLGPGEAVSAATAMQWWFGTGATPARPRRIAIGAPADLVVLGAPLAAALSGDGPVPVLATVIAGQIVTVSPAG
jgi:predicted amidohydrolase YtcJ